MVSAESMYGIFVIFSGSWLCVNISSSELYLMSLKYFLCGCVLHKKETPAYVPVNTNFKFSVIKSLCSFKTWSLHCGGGGQQSLLWRHAVSNVRRPALSGTSLILKQHASPNVSNYQWTRRNIPEVLAFVFCRSVYPTYIWPVVWW
jgi:hypothetical protein